MSIFIYCFCKKMIGDFNSRSSARGPLMKIRFHKIKLKIKPCLKNTHNMTISSIRVSNILNYLFKNDRRKSPLSVKKN